MKNLNFEKINDKKTFINNMNEAAEKKAIMTTHFKRKYLLRAMMSGLIISFVYAIFLVFKANLIETPMLANFLGSWLFAIALILIYYTHSELATSNFMILPVGKYFKKVTIKKTVFLLFLCVIGNFIGSILMTILFMMTTVLSSPEIGEMMLTIINGKIDHSSLDILFRAILCTFAINLAIVIVYSGRISSDFGKISILAIAVFMFMYLGLDHVIANAALFIFGWFYIPGTFETTLALNNLFWALIGNFIGAAGLVGLYYAYLGDSRSYDKE